MSKPKLKDLASRITAHLKRFEDDPAINHRSYKGIPPYWNSYCWAAGSRVFVRYVSFQGSHSLKRDEAAGYLAWLDTGKVGMHWSWLREEGKS